MVKNRGKNTAKTVIYDSLSNKLESEQMSKQSRACERAKLAVLNKRVAQYLRLDSWLFWTKVHKDHGHTLFQCSSFF